jgi:hypothetical protein
VHETDNPRSFTHRQPQQQQQHQQQQQLRMGSDTFLDV